MLIECKFCKDTFEVGLKPIPNRSERLMKLNIDGVMVKVASFMMGRPNRVCDCGKGFIVVEQVSQTKNPESEYIVFNGEAVKT